MSNLAVRVEDIGKQYEEEYGDLIDPSYGAE